MLKIEDRKWREFKVKDLFYITGSKTTSKNSLEKIGAGIYPYVTTQTTNNGQAGYYDFYTEKGNILVIDSAVAGFCTYQQNDFTASDHVEKLIPKFKLNYHIALFLTNIINKNNSLKFSYGYKACQNRLESMIILLPVNTQDEPDFAFMEQFVKERIEAKTQKYLDYIESELRGGVEEPLKKLQNVKWKEFKIGDLFASYRGDRQISKDRKSGDVPYYSASNLNNGLTDMISNPSFVEKNNAIIYSTFGNAYYVNKNFTASDEITILQNNSLNKYCGLFIVQAMLQNKEKYSFGRKAFSNKILKDKILLPVNKYDEPDFELMENYIKAVLKNKLQKYLNCK